MPARQERELDEGVSESHPGKRGHVRRGLVELRAGDHTPLLEPLAERLVVLRSRDLDDSAVAEEDRRAAPVGMRQEQAARLAAHLEDLEDVAERQILQPSLEGAGVGRRRVRQGGGVHSGHPFLMKSMTRWTVFSFRSIDAKERDDTSATAACPDSSSSSSRSRGVNAALCASSA